MEIFLYKAFKEQLSLLFETWSYWTWSSGLAWIWIFQSLLSSTGLQAHSTILCLPGIWFLCLCMKHFTSWTISSVCFITFSMIISLLNTCFNYSPIHTPTHPHYCTIPTHPAFFIFKTEFALVVLGLALYTRLASMAGSDLLLPMDCWN